MADIKTYRNDGSPAALVFVHGFSASSATWDQMAAELMSSADARGWDLFAVSYSTRRFMGFVPFWSKDPDLDLLSRQFSTAMSLSPLAQYRAVMLVGHSMGGLILQRSLIDDDELRTRTTSVTMFGTPSLGLQNPIILYKRQTRDIKRGSAFLKSLRADWNMVIGGKPPFALQVVSGSKDIFVGPETSINPFPRSFQRTVEGDHSSIVHPLSANEQSVRLLLDVLSGREFHESASEGAILAVERGQYYEAIRRYGSCLDDLDDAAIGELALAFEETGEGDKALELLEKHYASGKSSTDAKGFLAGRLKRRWLLSRANKDLERAEKLYGEALAEAIAVNDGEQIYYHAINLAFLEVLRGPRKSPVPARAREYVKQALQHCASQNASYWAVATQAEAQLIGGDFEGSITLYRRAIALSRSPRASYSMYSQALYLTDHMYGERKSAKLRQVFSTQAEE